METICCSHFETVRWNIIASYPAPAAAAAAAAAATDHSPAHPFVYAATDIRLCWCQQLQAASMSFDIRQQYVGSHLVIGLAHEHMVDTQFVNILQYCRPAVGVTGIRTCG